MCFDFIWILICVFWMYIYYSILFWKCQEPFQPRGGVCNQGYIIKYVFALLHLFWECSCACERIFLAQRRPTSSINKYITWSLKPVLLPVPANILHYMIYVKYLDTSHFVVQIDASFVNTDEYCLSWVKLSR